MGLSNLCNFSSYLQVEGVFISVFEIVKEFARCSSFPGLSGSGTGGFEVMSPAGPKN